MQLLANYQAFCKKHHFQTLEEQIKVIHILEKFANTFLTRKMQQDNRNIISRILDQIPFIKAKPSAISDMLGVYIYGGVGRGKSMLMDLFYEDLPIKNKQRIHFHKFMQDVHHQLRQARARNEPDALIYVADQIANRTQFICFDEFQVLDITDAMILGRLFTALIERHVYFIMTSNRHPDDLYLNGLNRQLFLPFIALLNTRFHVTTLNHATDFRLEKIQHQNHYIFPLSTQTKATLDYIWHSLTDDHKGNICTLEHAGRTIKLNKTYKHIAYVSFNDLCDIALGASDYLLIADKFSVLLLDNIPQLTQSMRNQTTRFRNLIDAFYEKRHKIYFRAAVDAHELYIKGDYHFEFERTISRIQEMQAKDYGK